MNRTTKDSVPGAATFRAIVGHAECKNGFVMSRDLSPYQRKNDAPEIRNLRKDTRLWLENHELIVMELMDLLSTKNEHYALVQAHTQETHRRLINVGFMGRVTNEYGDHCSGRMVKMSIRYTVKDLRETLEKVLVLLGIQNGA